MRLGARGRIEHLALKPHDDVGRWIEDFLRVEELASRRLRDPLFLSPDAYRRFFRETATGGVALRVRR